MLNWPLILSLFILAIPGCFIAIPRLVSVILPLNTEPLRQRISRLLIIQTLLMVFLMSIAGAAISLRTGMDSTLLRQLLLGQVIRYDVLAMILPVFLWTAAGLTLFLVSYYGLGRQYLEEKTFTTLENIRNTLRLDGCVLYGGVVEEILARWGLLNVVAFFLIMTTHQKSTPIFWSAIFIASFLYVLSHLPAYFAAGCKASLRFILFMILTHGGVAILFSWIFWQYGLVAAMVSHALFHTGWYVYAHNN